MSKTFLDRLEESVHATLEQAVQYAVTADRASRGGETSLDSQTRKLLQYIVNELPASEPDWFLDSESVPGHVYSEAIHLLHMEANKHCHKEDDL